MEDRKQNCFDFLRLFAASCVLISHSVEHLQGSFLWFKSNTIYWFYDGVPLFFILSGMLVYKSYEKCIESKKPIWAFFVNRFLRVAPAIYVYFIIQAIILILIKVVNLKSIFTIQFLGWGMSNILLIPVYSPGLFKDYGVGSINGSLWTIPAEISFYLMVPLIYYFIKRFGIKHSAILLFTVSFLFMLMRYYFTLDPAEPMYEKFYKVFFMPYLLFFCLGIFLSKYWTNIKQSKSMFVLSVLLYVLIRYDVFAVESYIAPISKALWAFPLGYAVIWFGYYAPSFFNKLTKALGDLSYGIYVWHMVIINGYIYLNLNYKLAFLPDTINVITIYIITIFIAYISWHIIEKPFLELKPFTSNTQAIKCDHNKFMNIRNLSRRTKGI